LKSRSFQGVSYRGAVLSDVDLSAYRWTYKSKNRIIETCTLQSTSIDRKVAEFFAPCDTTQTTVYEQTSVLMIFYFPVACPSAINLSALDGERSLSNFEDENEVLILPFTLFEIQYVDLMGFLNPTNNMLKFDPGERRTVE
ncbi:unnamed protein product, partial [Didymodactylos carnosus]